MLISIHLKYWLLTYYWWLIFVALVAALEKLQAREASIATIATVFGVILSLAYFLQKQKLEETRLFREIFKECNERYELMRDALEAISQKDPSAVDEKERAQVVDYLNLCGEEYLYFKRGYIDPAVWKAWHNGMKHLAAFPSIQLIWNQERKTGSYYDLPLY